MELLTGSVTWIDDEANTLKTDGVIRVANGQALVAPNHPPVTHVSGGVVFDSNLVRLLDVEGKIDDSKVFVKEATLEWRESDILGDVQVEGQLSAHDVYQAILRILPADLFFSHGPSIVRFKGICTSRQEFKAL